MTVFISHSSEDKALYSALALAIDSHGLSRWDVRHMTEGRPLADQLREAVRGARQCVFLATTNSVGSLWCLAEVGAFWGAGKPVIVFLGEPELTEDKLPPQLRGTLYTYDAERLVRALKENHSHHATDSDSVRSVPIFSNVPPDPIESEWGPEVEQLIERTREAAKAKDFNLAYKLSIQAAELAPDCVRAHGNMATALVHLRRYEEAEEKYKEIISRFPEYHELVARTLHNLAWLEINRSGLDDRTTIEKCKNLYLKSLALDNRRLTTRAMHLICLALLEEDAEAVQFLKASIKWDGFISALSQQVELLGRQGFNALSRLPEWLSDVLYPSKGATLSAQHIEE